MHIDRSHTAAFSGHRSHKIAAGERGMIARRLHAAIAELADGGIDTFLCGMAESFDLMAALAVAELRARKGGLRLVAVVPFPGQAERFTSGAAAGYRKLLESADHTVTISPEYDPGVYHRRNDYMLDNASRMVCYYNGSRGGTRYCWQQALARGLKPINLYGVQQTGYLF